MKIFPLMALLLITFSSACAKEPPEGAIASEQATFQVAIIANELDHPWSVAFLPGGDFLVTERRGTIQRISSNGTKTAIRGVPEVVTGGQAGLFDIALAPDFAESRIVYFAYAGAGEGGSNTEVVQSRLDLQKNTLTDLKIIFRAEPKVDKGENHYGGRLLFAPDGSLFITLGERYKFMEEAQNTGNHLGTIVRLNPDGSIPDDNPFTGNNKAKPEIYSYGHRNTQGIAIQPGTNRIWQHEHGPKGGDEVNILKPGANYGWPEITYGIDYTGFKITDKTAAPGMEQPVIHWTPSIAPSGMAFYQGDKFPEWRGDIFVGALAKTHLRRLEVNGTEITGQEVLLDGIARIRDVRTGPDGFLYLLTDETDGRLMRLEPANSL